MQKRTSKRWPFRPHADEREDPWHPDFEPHPERNRGAEFVVPAIERARRGWDPYLEKPTWPDWEGW